MHTQPFDIHPGFTLFQLMQKVLTGGLIAADFSRSYTLSGAQVCMLLSAIYGNQPIAPMIMQSIEPGRYRIIDGRQRLMALISVVYGKAITAEDGVSKRLQVAFNPQLSPGRCFSMATSRIRGNPAWISDLGLIIDNDTDPMELAYEYCAMNTGCKVEAVLPAFERACTMMFDHVWVAELPPECSDNELYRIFCQINKVPASLVLGVL